MEQVVVVDTTLFGEQVAAVLPHQQVCLLMRLQTEAAVEPTPPDLRITLDT
jgi:hypothetical protein